MLTAIAAKTRKTALGAAFAMLAAFTVAPLAAQSIETVDPDMAIDADLAQTGPAASPADSTVPSGDTELPRARYDSQASPYAGQTLDLPEEEVREVYPAPAQVAANEVAQPAAATSASTYGEDDLIGAAEGLFGQGAEGLARLIEDILEKQGEPNGYIVGREGGGAFVLGVRYGSGTLFHKVEGNMPVYWTGPSIGFDAGANAGNTFVLVYNLYDTDELYERYPAGEGQAYLVGGFTASYLRKGNIVLIPIRVGAGLRLGVNAGYMRFSHKQRWLPF